MNDRRTKEADEWKRASFSIHEAISLKNYEQEKFKNKQNFCFPATQSFGGQLHNWAHRIYSDVCRTGQRWLPKMIALNAKCARLSSSVPVEDVDQKVEKFIIFSKISCHSPLLCQNERKAERERETLTAEESLLLL